ncbi:MAG: prepilin-type N-terminal cleavage/methylation domain-containing protein [Candidatus Magasanikbacteria bacterium]
MRFRTKKEGFTLIEMLVVVAIIGLLSSAVLVGLNDARQRARDARRISDLRQIQNGLELYYNSNGRYPPNEVYGTLDANLPKDPQGGEYYYVAKNSQFYVLGACLEKKAPSGAEGYTKDQEIEIENSPLPQPPTCNCKDKDSYCVSIGEKKEL